jgi:predicted phosphodiesterase
MRITHISDIHFGAAENKTLVLLRDKLNVASPDLIIISGDITQNGYESEFIAAQEYFATISGNKIFVPGNHDMPQWDVLKRITRPYKLYKKYICDDLEPVLITNEIVIMGINTARIFIPHHNWANGAISGRQIKKILQIRKDHPNAKVIIIAHHPLNKILDAPIKYKVFGANAALRAIKQAKIDLVLSGHLHKPAVQKIHDTLFITAPSAASYRARGYKNGYMEFDVTQDAIKINEIDY